MSNFLAMTIHPVAGIAMHAMWHANYFGTRYGVEFHGDDEIYPAHECEQVEIVLDDNAKLSEKPWNQLTEAEKRAWSEAAAKKGPALFGSATVDPIAFRDTVVRSWNRNQKHTY